MWLHYFPKQSQGCFILTSSGTLSASQHLTSSVGTTVKQWTQHYQHLFSALWQTAFERFLRDCFIILHKLIHFLFLKCINHPPESDASKRLWRTGSGKRSCGSWRHCSRQLFVPPCSARRQHSWLEVCMPDASALNFGMLMWTAGESICAKLLGSELEKLRYKDTFLLQH